MEKILKETISIDDKVDEVKLAMKSTKNVRMYKRYTVLLRHFEGYSNVEIANMVCLEQHTVGSYIRDYNNKGLAGLQMRHSTGAPRKLSKVQEKLIVETVTTKTPDEVGFESRKNWTIEIIRQWIIKSFNVVMSHRGTAEVLYRLNLSYTRPTYVLKKADKEKQEEFKIKFEGLKKTSEW